ncbi:hypothetical protein A2477_00180 [Candidatus Falkowbacteria bacterium RIFOXYC2_FULL_47_12]|uniref:Inositol-1-monophosphatase n=2 Tax=Candidatus Falkowiibacteriota TaxID=1752728 RepID=A0A1F5TRB3_9BACT|nr:MAG: hypothetical protein A2242_04100 [Candidatus Falkowbacteria bacterium RIFOXYA2_FULL_47_9]OGF41091.1 MAG: hypothetical protein A2477_00180 [Candidatus Falkowbacteria bacterium RIFOXYC2_FULL_47_12]
MNLDFEQKVAIHAAKKAGRLLMAHLNKVKEITYKAKRDIVTEVDLRSEEIIISSLKNNFPKHDIFSEEKGSAQIAQEKAEYLWLIDPIDGTINYSYGMAPFRVGICLLKAKIPVLSVIYNPVKNEMYVAQRGRGATMNGRKITVSSRKFLSETILSSHLSSKKDARRRVIKKLEKIFNAVFQIRFYGSLHASLTYIAGGKEDACVWLQTNSWDILPGALLVEEAGGKVTDVNGEKITINSTDIVASNGGVHEQLLKVIKNI